MPGVFAQGVDWFGGLGKSESVAGPPRPPRKVRHVEAPITQPEEEGCIADRVAAYFERHPDEAICVLKGRIHHRGCKCGRN